MRRGFRRGTCSLSSATDSTPGARRRRRLPSSDRSFFRNSGLRDRSSATIPKTRSTWWISEPQGGEIPSSSTGMCLTATFRFWWGTCRETLTAGTPEGTSIRRPASPTGAPLPATMCLRSCTGKISHRSTAALSCAINSMKSACTWNTRWDIPSFAVMRCWTLSPDRSRFFPVMQKK